MYSLMNRFNECLNTYNTFEKKINTFPFYEWPVHQRYKHAIKGHESTPPTLGTIICALHKYS